MMQGIEVLVDSLVVVHMLADIPLADNHHMPAEQGNQLVDKLLMLAEEGIHHMLVAVQIQVDNLDTFQCL
jgi:hypothetical protein